MNPLCASISVVCKNENYDDNNICKARTTYKKWQISSHGLVNGTLAMMNEIYRNGPIACAVAEVPDLMHYKKDFIFKMFRKGCN